MSRIGRRIITLPDGVTIDVAPGRVTVTGPKGTLEQNISPDMTVTVNDGVITIGRPTDRPNHRALHGLTRSLLANMVEGVSNGYVKELEIQGVGYRCAAQGKNLELALGYSHPVKYNAPEGIEFEVPQPTQIIIRGIDKQRVGQVASEIRKLRPPEPYKGKGIRYAGEHVARKVGKRA
ncbi:MAG: 50S ribosomal protein L6 [Actinobacteria bacterium]|nr:50S ribosomal protein L6 [Actinomycetota bacterium]